MSVSIITPSYNSATFIKEALWSIKSELSSPEMVVVDGGSTDTTLSILMDSKLGVNMHWVSKKDSGPAEAINNGFRLARGSIFGWLNSDDFYAKGAIDRALQAFEENPKWVMVYGHAQHVDINGLVLGDYPTLPPRSNIQHFKKGSFICQPTIFIRREVVEEIGFLDESLKTAFDFDYWLRIFKHYPRSRIGFIDEVQAYSRLHDACLTRKFRKTVAVESIKVIFDHLGSAPGHWIQTYFDELCSQYPFIDDSSTLVEQLKSALVQVKPFILDEEFTTLVKSLQNDSRLRFSSQQCFVGVQPDGWVSKKLHIKLRCKPDQPKTIKLQCSVGWPDPPADEKNPHIYITIRTPDAQIQKLKFEAQEQFILNLEAPETQTDEFMVWAIETRQFFIPEERIKKSKDSRKLSFRVDGVTLV
jgi:glycosyltransferase involved in cell wall biosynthesis